MSIEPVYLAPLQEIRLSSDIVEPKASADFAAWMEKGISAVNEKIGTADKQIQQLAAGNVENLHQVMIVMEEAKLSFQLLLQVRNRVLEAYQDILRTQV